MSPSSSLNRSVLIRFDEVDEWAPDLTAALEPHVPESAKQRICEAAPQYIEDARDLLFEECSRECVIDATLAWIRRRRVAGYHGTRLTDTDVSAMQAEGLIPLNAQMRRVRLTRALSVHARWSDLATRLDAEIEKYGTQGAGGVREQQAHLTLSRAGLTDSFNHYLTHGSEFDQCVAVALLGDEGLALLAQDGCARVIEFAVPGEFALNAAHPFFSVDDTRRKGDVPNIVEQFLQVWSFRQAHPRFQWRRLQLDCGMIFSSTVPAEWIVTIDTVSA